MQNQKSFRPLSTTTNNSCDQPPTSTQQQLSSCQLPQQPILLNSPVYPDKPVCDSTCQPGQGPGAEAEVAEQDSDKENRQLASFSPTASHDTLGKQYELLLFFNYVLFQKDYETPIHLFLSAWITPLLKITFDLRIVIHFKKRFR